MLQWLYGDWWKGGQEKWGAWYESLPKAKQDLLMLYQPIRKHAGYIAWYKLFHAVKEHDDRTLRLLLHNDIIPKLPPDARDKINRLGRGTEWASFVDVSLAGLSNPDRPVDTLILGTMTDTDGDPSNVQFHGEGHLITIAPTGAGKGQGHIIPNLHRYLGPVVVLDPKGENYRATGEHRGRYGRVFKWAPFEEDTAKFNPLEFVRNWDDARILADLLIVSEGRADPFWDRSARDLMTGLIQFVKNNRPEELQNMREIARLASPSRADKSDLLEALLESRDEKLIELANSIESWHDGMEASIFQSLRSHLDVWRSEEIAKATDETTDDLWPGDILHSSYFEELTAAYGQGVIGPEFDEAPDGTVLVTRGSAASVYIVMPPDRIHSYRAVLRVLIGTMLNRVQKAAAMIEEELQEEENPAMRRLPTRPVLFIIDELPQLGYMEIIERLVAIARSAKIRLWLFVQNIEQLTRVYPQAGTILDNCRAQIFFKPNGMETAQLISNRLGRGRDLWGQEDWVLSPQDAMGPDYDGKQFIFLRGQKPILADLDLWYKRHSQARAS